MSDLVLYAFHDGIATLTLNRPDKGNAIDLGLGRALAAAVDRAVAQPGLRVLLIQAAGKAFCVGGDIGEMQRTTDLPGFLAPAVDALHAAVQKLAALPAPIITVVRGAVGGGGMGLALCGDFVLAGEAMKLRGGYSAIGLTPDLGASWYLARRAGGAMAKKILFLNEVLDGDACLQAGVVDAVYPDHELAEAGQALAARLAAGATLSLQRIATMKQALEIFAREIAPAGTSWSPGTTGPALSRPAASPLIRQFAFTLPKKDVAISRLIDGRTQPVAVPVQGGYEPGRRAAAPANGGAADEGPTVQVPLVKLAYARSGDKGDLSNIGVIARKPAYLPLLQRELTPAAAPHPCAWTRWARAWARSCSTCRWRCRNGWRSSWCTQVAASRPTPSAITNIKHKETQPWT